MNNYINIDDLLTIVRQQIPSEKVSDLDIIMWTEEILSLLRIPELLVPDVDVVDVRDYKGVLPFGLVAISQILKNDTGKPIELKRKLDNTCTCFEQVSDTSNEEDVVQNLVCDTESAVEVCPLQKYLWSFVDYFNELPKKFTLVPVRKATGNFSKIHSDIFQGGYEYMLLDNSTIITSFKDGQVLISYLSFKKDDEGRILVPYDMSIINAIVNYVKFHAADKNAWEGDLSMIKMADSYFKLYMHYIVQAKSKYKMPKDSDDIQRLIDRFRVWIPTFDYYKY